jgi:hypothetical protein
VHGGLLVAAVFAFYKYGDRTDLFDKSLAGTNAVLRVLRRDIAFKLASRLQPVFDGASAVIEISLVDAGGNPISEVSVNPVGSENYNDALFDFVEGNDLSLVHYRLLLHTRDRWCGWAKSLSWAILILMSLEAVFCGYLLWSKLVGHFLAGHLLVVTFCATAISFVSCLVPLIFLLCAHDKISELRKRYDLP